MFPADGFDCPCRGGGQSIYTSITNRKPTVVTIDEIVASKPAAVWIRVEKGMLDARNSAYFSTFGVGEVSKVIVALVPKGENSSDGTIHLLVETSDTRIVDLANGLRDLDRKISTKAAIAQFLAENAENFRVERSVEGLVKFGMESGKKERKIKELYASLTPDVLILEEGTKPDPYTGILLFAIGVLAGFFFLRRFPNGKTPPPLPRSAESSQPMCRDGGAN